MVTPSVNQFWQFIAVSLQLREGYVAQRFDRREVTPQQRHALFALCAPLIVFTARMPVLDHGIADHHGQARRQWQSLEFQRTAIQHDGVIRACEAGGKLVHDTYAGTYEFVLRMLAELCDFDEIQSAS